jgi:hypothetical protein
VLGLYQFVLEIKFFRRSSGDRRCRTLTATSSTSTVISV